MNDDLLILKNNKKLKYGKRVMSARFTIFILAGICLSIAVFATIMGIYTDGMNDAMTVLFSFGGIGLFYLISGFLSIRKPFAPVLFAAVVNTVIFIALAASVLFTPDLCHETTIPIALFILFFLGLVLVRGVVYAIKYKQLMALQ